MHARGDDGTALAALAAALAAVVIVSAILIAPVRAQDIGFGLDDPYRRYADPGNGGGSTYAPFFDPYRGNRIVRGAYPDAIYDGHGYHYGKSTPPPVAVDPRSYDPESALSNDAYERGDKYRLREGENETTRVAVEAASRHLHRIERSGRALRHRSGVGRQGLARNRRERARGERAGLDAAGRHARTPP